MAVVTKKLGPGTLQIGVTGSQVDVSCQINGARVAASKDQGDATTKLCGDSVPGAVTYSYTLSGNMDIDAATADGFFALSWAEPGSEQPFTYTPNSDLGTTVTGNVVIDPLDFGADNYGDDLNSDFEFACVDKPTFTYGKVTPPANGQTATDTDDTRETVTA